MYRKTSGGGEGEGGREPVPGDAEKDDKIRRQLRAELKLFMFCTSSNNVI